MFVDDDCLPDRAWLASYRQAIRENPGSKAFEGSIFPSGDLDCDLADCPVNVNGGVFWSANICVERTFFLTIKGFDEAFLLPAHEDQDLFLRIKPQTRVPFVRTASVSHPVRRSSLRKVLKDIDRRNVTWIYFATKNAAKLKYQSKAEILAAGYSTHLRGGFAALRRGYPKKFVYHGVMVFLGLPMQGLRLMWAPSLGSHH